MSVRVGIQLHPQQATWEQMRDAWVRAEEMGADTIFNWDHFFPLYGDPEGPHYECFTVLGAMSQVTHRVQFGPLVACNAYRNPNLLADMARTIDQMSNGRFILGIGSGWFERDFEEYGYEFGTARSRFEELAESLPVIRERLQKLNPGPVDGHLPILIGGTGRRITLRLAAEYADIWHGFGGPEEMGELNQVLDNWCREIGRNPQEIERSVTLEGDQLGQLDAYVSNGVTHILCETGGTEYDLAELQRLIEWRDSRRDP